MTFAIKNHPPEGGDIVELYSVVFGFHPVLRAINNLQNPQPQDQNGKHQENRIGQAVESELEEIACA
jgi:hypothetical protein